MRFFGSKPKEIALVPFTGEHWECNVFRDADGRPVAKIMDNIYRRLDVEPWASGAIWVKRLPSGNGESQS